jgi:hypothetical protein
MCFDVGLGESGESAIAFEGNSNVGLFEDVGNFTDLW